MATATPYADDLAKPNAPKWIILGVFGTTLEMGELEITDDASHQERLNAERSLLEANRKLIEPARLANQIAEEAEESEGLVRSEPVKTLDKSATFESLQYQRTKSALIRLAGKFAVEAVSVGETEGSIIDMMTVDAAVHFLLLLPTNYQLPKIAPDEDGIIMVWNTPQKATVITFVGYELHTVDNAGSTESHHIAPIQFDGMHIPQGIVHCLPMRGGA